MEHSTARLIATVMTALAAPTAGSTGPWDSVPATARVRGTIRTRLEDLAAQGLLTVDAQDAFNEILAEIPA